MPLRIRSMVGLIPLFAGESLDDELITQLPIFEERWRWFFENRPELARTISIMRDEDHHHAAARDPEPRAPRARAEDRARRVASSCRRTASARCRAYTRSKPYVLRSTAARTFRAITAT